MIYLSKGGAVPIRTIRGSASDSTHESDLVKTCENGSQQQINTASISSAECTVHSMHCDLHFFYGKPQWRSELHTHQNAQKVISI